jgi:predicted nucleic acid-binding protein
MQLVIDATVLLAWLFKDAASAATDELRDSLEHTAVLVPATWPVQVAGALCAAVRRGRLARAEIAHVVELLEALPIKTDARTPEQALDKILPLALEQDLPVADAAYLELAMREALPLATLDERLAAAAERCGVRRVP